MKKYGRTRIDLYGVVQKICNVFREGGVPLERYANI